MTNLVKRFARNPRTIPVFIFVLLGLPVLLHAGVIVLAEQHPSLVVDGDYFLTPEQQAESRRALQEFEAKGWILDIGEVSRSPVDGGFGFELAIVDSQKLPLDDFEYTVDLFHHARARHVVQAEIIAAGNGRVHVRAPAYRRGPWQIRVDATNGESTYPLVRSIWVP